MPANPDSEPINVTIHGAAGRMGRRLIDLIYREPGMNVVGAMEAGGHPNLEDDAGTIAGIGPIGVPIGTSIPDETDVVVDFSTGEAVHDLLHRCQQRQLPLVIATTGLPHNTADEIHKIAESIPIVWSPNMSLAVNLTMKLAEVTAGALKNSQVRADVEIIETHHRFKADAPSGTALKFGQLIAEVMGQTEHRHGRHGVTGERPENEIGYHAVRAGDDPGQHTLLFGMMGEKIELKVAATDRDCYARGAIAAARFLVGKAPGLYTMFDVLGL